MLKPLIWPSHPRNDSAFQSPLHLRDVAKHCGNKWTMWHFSPQCHWWVLESEKCNLAGGGEQNVKTRVLLLDLFFPSVAAKTLHCREYVRVKNQGEHAYFYNIEYSRITDQEKNHRLFQNCSTWLFFHCCRTHNFDMFHRHCEVCLP